MANIDAKRTIRTFKDFSLGLSTNGGGSSGGGIMIPIVSTTATHAELIPLNLVHIYYLIDEEEEIEIELPQTILNDDKSNSYCYINEQFDIEKPYTLHITIDEGVEFGAGGASASMTSFWDKKITISEDFDSDTREVYIGKAPIGVLTILNYGGK